MEELCDWVHSFKVIKLYNLIATSVASILWTLWKIRNKACFKNVYTDDPVNVVSRISHNINASAGLQQIKFRDRVRFGAKLLLVVASEIFRRKKG
jgi:hypothetical protein